MRVLLWNVRGLGKLARRGHIRDFIHTERIDIVGLQETVKSEFSKDLEEIGVLFPFTGSASLQLADLLEFCWESRVIPLKLRITTS